jgi:hypothetical protein
MIPLPASLVPVDFYMLLLMYVLAIVAGVGILLTVELVMDAWKFRNKDRIK